jgi:hypothetical protein
MPGDSEDTSEFPTHRRGGTTMRTLKVPLRTVTLTLLLGLLLSSQVPAWEQGGVPVSTAPGHQNEVSIIPDGAGGAVLCWKDQGIACAYPTVYVQRVDSLGNLRWAENVLVSSTLVSDESPAALLLDDEDAVIVTWRSNYDVGADICAQRIDASGARLWGSAGIVLDTDTEKEDDSPGIVPDGEGGAIIVWDSGRTDIMDIYAARVTPGGSILWGPTCLHKPNDGDYQGFSGEVNLVSDGEGGAIATWWTFDGRYVQRIDNLGNLQWAPDSTGKQLQVPTPHYEVRLVPDGAHGAIIAWIEDQDCDEEYDIRAQKISSSAAEIWAPWGVLVHSGLAREEENAFSCAPDDAGGVIVSWRDLETCAWTSWSQRVTSAGATAWGSGVPICTAGGWRSEPGTIADGSGGCILAWLDARSWATLDVYCQRLDSSGEALWCYDGCLLHEKTYGEIEGGIVTDGAGGAIVFWNDYRNGSFNADLFVQRILSNGCAYVSGVEEPEELPAGIAMGQNHPNPFREATEIGFALGQPGRVAVRIYGIGGRLVRTLVDEWREPGRYHVAWDGRTLGGERAAPGVYLCELETTGARATRKMILVR